MNQSTGYIYIMVNPAFQKNWLKIGKTKRDPDVRARELSAPSGVPSDYFVAYKKKVSDCDIVEIKVHKALQNSGVRS